MEKTQSIVIEPNTAIVDIYTMMNNVRINNLESLFFDYLNHYGIKESKPKSYTISDLYNAIALFPIDRIVQGETFCIYVKGEIFGSMEIITGHSITQCFKRIKQQYKEFKKLGVNKFIYPFCEDEHDINKRILDLYTL